MRIRASVGNAPRAASLSDTVYNLQLTANTQGEKRWLAGLLSAVERVDDWDMRLRDAIPTLRIVSVEAADAAKGESV